MTARRAATGAAALLLAAVLLAGCAVLSKPRSHHDLAAMLEPHYHVIQPRGAEPFPAVMLFHMAGAIDPGSENWNAMLAWGDDLAARGYLVLVVDSMTPRGLGGDDLTGPDGLWGNRRSADVVVALDYLRRHADVDASRIGAVGWSHGGWTLLDALAYNPPARLPGGLSSAPAAGLKGLRAVVALYPYCAFPAEFRKGWTAKVPVLMILAADDRVTSPAACRDIAEAQAGIGFPVVLDTLPDVGHAFDYPWSDADAHPGFRHDAEATARAKEMVADFLARHLRPDP